jgi:hypothetical protein
MRRAIAILALMVTACSSASGTSGGKPGGTPPKTVVAGWSDKGHSVSLHKGDVLQVTLNSTYWQFAPAPKGGVLSQDKPTVHTKRMRYPGSGAGTVVVTYHAMHAGTATITASRVACGEAMRCMGGQTSYRLTVVVD